MMTRTYSYLARLQSDPAVYWLDSHLFADYRVSKFVHDAEFVNQQATALRAQLEQDLRRDIPRDWHGCTIVKEEHDDPTQFCIVYTLRACEQPAWARVELWSVPHPVPTFRIAPQGAPIVDLKLRPLWYRGERASGALYDDVLYVVLAQEP